MSEVLNSQLDRPDQAVPADSEGGEYNDQISDFKGLHPILTPASDRRDRIRQQVVTSIKKTLPVEGSRYRLDVQDVEVQKKHFTMKDQDDAILERRSLTEPIKGTLVIKDQQGNVLDKSRRTLAHIPWMTDAHTFIMDGNPYSVGNQVRIKPGVYTRERANGELEAAFNLGRGKNFRLAMEPAKGIFFLQYDSTKIALYPVLRALGITDGELATSWGSDLVAKNRSAAKNSRTQLKKLYTKLTYPKTRLKNPSESEMAEAILAAYQRTVLNPSVTKKTLGKGFSKVEAQTLISASKKLLRVFNRQEQGDDRDSLEFKTLHTVDTFFKERIEKDAARKLNFKMRNKLNRTSAPTVKQVVPSAPFSPALRGLITTSALSTNPSQINPIEVLDGALKVTSLGEGGISSLRAVPDSTRDQHGSQMGVIDPIRTPESGSVGVDVRATMYAAVDERGNMHTPLIDARTGKPRYVPVTEFSQKNVAFPGTSLKKGRVPVLRDNKVIDVSSKDVDFIVPNTSAMYSPATTLVPMLNSQQGNRNLMGAKMQTQAVPLIHREAPLIQTDSGDGKTAMEKRLAEWHLPTAPVAGKIKKIDRSTNQIVVTPRGGGEDVRIDYARNSPFASKTRLHHTLSVKAGDAVKKGQVLGDSNFTQNGTMALGTNLRVGYMAYKGLNSNDATVISSSAAKKLTSEHSYRETLRLTADTTPSADKHRVYFGSKYGHRSYENLNSDGTPKDGAVINPGEIVIAAIEKKQMSADDVMLGRLNKSLVKPFRDAAVTWDHSHPGKVIRVVKTAKHITVQVHTLEPMGVGDKLSGRYGNKGVVSTILPDSQMPFAEDGNPLDIMLTSAGVNSRINPSQIIETAVAKVAKKTGKPIIMDQAPRHSRVKWAKGLLKKHGLKDKETVTDPTTGRKIPGIMVGDQYFLKLFKSTDTNFSTRAVGPKDVNQQPTKGGAEGAKSLGRMEFNALVAHNARSILREGATSKSDRNDEFWKRIQLGLPEATPKPSFAFNKFQGMMVGAGINMRKEGEQFSLGPLTDRDVDGFAQHTIKSPGVVKVRSLKDRVRITPEKGGLFDPAATGGLKGKKWSKIELSEPVVNPVFEKPAQELLGMTKAQFEKAMYSEGGAAMKARLNSIDLDKRAQQLQRQINAKIDLKTPTAAAQVDKWTKQLKYINSLRKNNYRAGDAYVISKVPVVPPVMRAVVTGSDGKALISDPNFLYKDLLLVDKGIRDTPDELKDLEPPDNRRRSLHGAVRAVFGTGDPVSDKTKARGARGFITQIAGQNSPKSGYFHGKLLKKRQDLSGRGTIAPDPTLALDEIGIPEEMLWKQYQPFVMRQLVQKGYTPMSAADMIEKKHVTAERELLAETQRRPMLVNRAPTLHRFGLVAAFPRPVSGKTIRLNPFAEIGMNADYDGDAVQLHVPATQAAVNDAREITLSKLIFSDGTKNDLMVKPQHETIIGSFLATHKKGVDKPREFANKEAAMAAYNRGEIKMSTPITIRGQHERP